MDVAWPTPPTGVTGQKTGRQGGNSDARPQSGTVRSGRRKIGEVTQDVLGVSYEEFEKAWLAYLKDEVR